MLQHLDERTVLAVARDSAMAVVGAGELLHEAGAPMDSVTFISQGRVKVYPIASARRSARAGSRLQSRRNASRLVRHTQTSSSAST